MPLQAAAPARGVPSNTMAMARRRRTCAPFRHLVASDRISPLLRSVRVIVNGLPISYPHRANRSPGGIESEINAEGTPPESRRQRGLVLYEPPRRLPEPVLALKGATSYWASVAANPPGHKSNAGARGTSALLVAPGRLARADSL
jgi:hypothetical protein